MKIMFNSVSFNFLFPVFFGSDIARNLEILAFVIYSSIIIPFAITTPRGTLCVCLSIWCV